MSDLFLTAQSLWALGLLAGGLSVFAYIPYISDTMTGRSRPQRASWFVWSVLGCISLASVFADGAGDAAGFVAAQVGGTLIVFALSLWRGQGTLLRGSDLMVLTMAGIGVGLWYLTDVPLYALAISISVSLVGGIATVRQAYQTPHFETKAFWGYSSIASIAALLSVGAFDPIQIAYPLYIFLLNSAVLVAMTLSPRHKRAPTLAGSTVQIVET